ncbi:MAG TPA: ABC transporter ATP-binding protein [Candidatus Saccharimonadales bacterium]|nr:ABC transporter ATP-binding protein [Candidatus Saccharimonadales bacterium]
MEKSDITKETIRYYWRHMRKYPRKLLGIFITVPLSVLLLGFIPSYVVSRILQRVSSGHYVHGQLWASFGPDLLLYAGAVLLSGVVLWRIAVYFVWTLEINVTRDVYRDVFDHLMGMSANFHSNRFSGSLVSQTNKLAGAYVMLADAVIFETLTLALAFIFTFVILVPRVPWIATFLIGFALVFIALSLKISKNVRELRHREASAETAQTGQLSDTITNIMAVKSFAGGGIERKLFARATGETGAASHRVMRAATKQDAIFGASTTLAGVVALVLAVASMVLFHANVGTAFLVITYSSGITQRLWDFVRGTLRNYNRGLGDARAMIGVLAIEPEVLDPEQPEKVRIKQGEITFDNMAFTHPDSRSNETLFDGLNLRIKAGEKIGLVGHSGSGKSTLTRLLLRFSDVDGGRILIDGQNIAAITQDDLRRNVAYVPQEPLLFHRTIRENIAYGKPDATKKEIEAAARKAYAGEFIAHLPQGYDTLVGERGVKLSGGQRQRIAIARAILKDAPILVLDEATSALDSESEKLIQAALWELMKGRTAIVIAHRLSTIQKMDRIIVLEDGAIAEEGTHKSLLTSKGTYAKLWAHQSGGFIED